MHLRFYQIDAFTSERFKGNPAGVVLSDVSLPEVLMQAIAAENNLAETAFVQLKDEPMRLRWFTPTVEVDLCGHATLASAFVLLEEKLVDGELVRFDTMSGPLTIERSGDLLRMDFPSRRPDPIPCTDELVEALGARPTAVLAARDTMAVFDEEAQVAELSPQFDRIAGLDTFAVMAIAPGREGDFVSRFFAPKAGIAEDPVTGSAHCTLIPYWSQRLGRRSLTARQVSRRGGQVYCEDNGDRVGISGRAVLYLRGTIAV